MITTICRAGKGGESDRGWACRLRTVALFGDENVWKKETQQQQRQNRKRTTWARNENEITQKKCLCVLCVCCVWKRDKRNSSSVLGQSIPTAAIRYIVWDISISYRLTAGAALDNIDVQALPRNTAKAKVIIDCVAAPMMKNSSPDKNSPQLPPADKCADGAHHDVRNERKGTYNMRGGRFSLVVSLAARNSYSHATDDVYTSLWSTVTHSSTGYIGYHPAYSYGDPPPLLEGSRNHQEQRNNSSV